MKNTNDAIVKRINRKLEKNGETHKVCKARGQRNVDALGEYYVLDTQTNSIVAYHVDPVGYLSELEKAGQEAFKEAEALRERKKGVIFYANLLQHELLTANDFEQVKHAVMDFVLNMDTDEACVLGDGSVALILIDYLEHRGKSIQDAQTIVNAEYAAREFLKQNPLAPATAQA